MLAYDQVLLEGLRRLGVDELLIHEMADDDVVIAQKRRRYSQIMQAVNYNWKPKKFVYMKHEGKIYVVRVR